MALGVAAVALSLATNPRWEWGVVAQWFTAQSVINVLLETLKLTGSDLPEIGDQFVVSKVLLGDRSISPRMAFALAERFHLDPKAFVSDTPTLPQ